MDERERGHAVVVGGSGDLGRAIALRLGKDGRRVTLLARDEARLRAAVEELRAGGVEALALVADATDRAAVAAALEKVASDAPVLDLVVHAAGLMATDFAMRAVPERWAKMLDANLVGVANVASAVVPHFRRAGRGTFVAIGSTAGQGGHPGLASYAASKAALRSYLATLQAEVLRHGMRVSLVSPDAVRSAAHQRSGRDPKALIPESAVAAAVAFAAGLAEGVRIAEIVLEGPPPVATE